MAKNKKIVTNVQQHLRTLRLDRRERKTFKEHFGEKLSQEYG